MQISILKELGRLREHELMQQVFDWAKATPEECQLRPQIGAYTTVLAAYTRYAWNKVIKIPNRWLLAIRCLLLFWS